MHGALGIGVSGNPAIEINALGDHPTRFDVALDGSIRLTLAKLRLDFRKILDRSQNLRRHSNTSDLTVDSKQFKSLATLDLAGGAILQLQQNVIGKHPGLTDRDFLLRERQRELAYRGRTGSQFLSPNDPSRSSHYNAC